MHKIQMLLTRDLTQDQFWFYIELITAFYIRLGQALLDHAWCAVVYLACEYVNE